MGYLLDDLKFVAEYNKADMSNGKFGSQWQCQCFFGGTLFNANVNANVSLGRLFNGNANVNSFSSALLMPMSMAISDLSWISTKMTVLMDFDFPLTLS